MRAIDEHQDLELLIVVGASAVLDRYGAVEDIIVRDGFEPAARVYMLLEGENPLTMAKSTAIGLLELPTVFDSLKPDVVVTVGDRFETLATAVAASYMNIPIAHTMGGEITGTIDESIRHAVTKLSHVHLVANQLAAENVMRLGEAPESVHVVGCPRIDLVAETVAEDGNVASSNINWNGVGPQIDLSQPFLLLSQHPVTTEFEQARSQIDSTLNALSSVELPTVALWPNADAGASELSSGIRVFREKNGDKFPIHFFKNLPPEQYTRLMNNTACVVGNTSSSIREGAFLGAPAVNIGTRQAGRERGKNVIDVGHQDSEITSAIRQQIDHGKYESDPIYGDGDAGRRIAEILASTEFKIQKQLVFST